MSLKLLSLAGCLLIVAGAGCAGPSTVADSPQPTDSPVAESPQTPPSPAVEDPAIAAQLLQNQKKFGLCQDNFNPPEGNQGTIAYRVNEQTYFVQVQCFLAAYQGNYEFWAYSPADATAKQLTVTEFTQDAQGQWQKVESPSIGGFPTFDPAQQVLTIQTKYRGAGDCGSMGTYKFADGTLTLTEFRAKAECDGKTEPLETIYP